MFVIKIPSYLLSSASSSSSGSGVITAREWDLGIDGIGVRDEDEQFM